MAQGLQQNKIQLKNDKIELKAGKKKLATSESKVKSLESDNANQATMLESCQRSTHQKVRSLHAKYRKDLDTMAERLQQASTQSLLSKRALQVCEAKSKGSDERATARVTRRTNRAVRRAKNVMNAKAKEKE